jgi:PIN domain nuclease of toxin-antitoxin system
MILVDTHILIWDALAPDQLSPRAQQTLAQANQQDGILICDISLWEIAMLLAKRRVQVATDSQTFLNLVLQANKITVQPITAQIAALAAQLPAPLDKDPADRLIAATAISEQIPLVTADNNLQSAKQLTTIW